MNSRQRKFVGFVVIAAIGGIIVYRYIHVGSTLDADRLCSLAQTYHMRCVSLASPTIYDHGAYVHLDSTNKENDHVSLPTDYVFSPQCSFASATAAFTQFKEDPTQYVAFGTHVFHVDRHLSAGVDLNLPRLAGLSVKAGPKISDIRSINLEAESARYFNIDTRAFLSTLSSCSVRPACASVVQSASVRVIKRLIVAKNLKYRVETATGESESLAAAVRSANLTVSMDSGNSSTSVDDLSSGKDMVFAVDFFDPKELQGISVCKKSVSIMKVTGTTVANASTGAPGYKGDREHSEDGSEVRSHERAPDSPDRKFNEGMKDPEATAWGLWNYETPTGTVSLYQRTQVDPGTRWLSDSHLNERPGSLRVWAVATASIDNEVEITAVNELEESKTLVAEAKFDVNTSASLFGNLPAYSYFHQLILISQDGTQHRVAPVWSRDERAKEFELGQIGPGEVVKVRVGRVLESVARGDDQAGAIQEDISLTLSVK